MKKRLLSLVLAVSLLMPFTAVTGFAENADNKLNTDIVEIQASGVSGGGAIVGTGSGLATPSGGVDMEVEDSTITPTQTPIVIEETQTPEETESPNNVIWDFDESTGTLTISGTGKMEDYENQNSMPWKEHRYSITSVVIEDGVTHIGNWAFYSFYYLETVTMGNSVTSIGNQAFASNQSLTTVQFSESLVSIGQNAFWSCGKLNNVTLYDNLRKIDSNAFNQCWALDTISLPTGLTEIGQDIFTNTSLDSDKSNWQDGLFYLGNYVFANNEDSMPEYVTIKDGTTLIPRMYYAPGMKVIYIPESVQTDFGDWYFPQTIIIEGEKGGHIETRANLYYIPFFAKGEVHKMNGELSANINWEIDFDTFTLTISGNGEMPEGSSNWSDYPWAYYGDYQKTVEIKEGVTTISKNSLPSAMTKLIVPRSVTAIYDTEIDSTVTVYGYKGSYAEEFAKTYGLLFCDENGNVTATGKCGEEAVWTYYQSTYKLVISGKGAMDSYDYVNDAPWSDFDIDEIEIENGITSIGANIFSADTSGFDWLIIPDSVINIDENAIKGYVNYVVIYCSENSYAHTWAEQRNRTHESYGQYQEIEVKSEDELTAALGSNRKIILADGLYTFNEQIVLKHHRNLEITAKNVAGAEILSREGYKPVVLINHCADTVLTNMILGHTSVSYQSGCGDSEYSSGYVIAAQYSKDILVDTCDLYGCGTVAVWLYDTLSFNADKCILRDCREKAVYHHHYDREAKAVFNDCIISGNAYDDKYATTVPNVHTEGADIEFNNCLFLNNYNTELTNDTSLVKFNDCRFENNIWNGKNPKDNGICLNGITWEIAEETTEWDYTYKIVKLGFPLEFEGGNIESKTGRVISYSQYSKPWKRDYYIEDMKLADGITLGGSCGEMAEWEIENGTLTISGEGKMTDFSSYAPWSDYNDMIENIVIEEGITRIGERAFSNCYKAKTLSISSTVTMMADNSITSMEGLEQFIVAENSEKYSTIDGVLFSKDKQILYVYPAGKDDVSYTVPEGTETIGDKAFYYVPLENITLPQSLKAISSNAFFYTNITKLTIPKNVYELSSSSFSPNPYLKEINVDTENENFVSVKGVVFSKDKTVLIAYPSGRSDMEYIVPNGVTDIANRAFYMTKAKSIKLSDTVKSVGAEAFIASGESGGIVKILIPESVTDIHTLALHAYSDVTIICKEGSAAHTYAIGHYLDYVFEDNIPITSAELVVNDSSGTYTVEVKAVLPDNRTVDGYIVAAIYDRNDTLMAVKKVAVTGDGVEFNIDTKKYPADRRIKILWWDFDGGNKPLSNAYEQRLR